MSNIVMLFVTFFVYMYGCNGSLMLEMLVVFLLCGMNVLAPFDAHAVFWTVYVLVHLD